MGYGDMGYGLWILGYEIWVMGYGVKVTGHTGNRLWVMGQRLWVISFSLESKDCRDTGFKCSFEVLLYKLCFAWSKVQVMSL